ncbi:MAG: sensor domain-containing diguanylate cyclase [Candidatus Ancaeobacter aquaticus]|nr:sensor domain-containing diguanylate cyclase [Candidatus Ancaeobacter aquaticus]
MKVTKIGEFRGFFLFVSYLTVLAISFILVFVLNKYPLQFYHILLIVVLIILPVLVVFTWFNYGILLSVVMSTFLSVYTILIAIALGRPIYYLYPIAFILLGMILLKYKETRRIKNEELRIKTEKLKEDFNILINTHEDAKGINKSLLRMKQRFLFFKDVAQNLSFTLPIDELLRRIIEYSNITIGKGDINLLFLVAKDLMSLELKAFEVISFEKRPLFTDPMDVFNRWVMRHQQPLLVTDVQKDYRFHIDTSQRSLKEVKSIIVAPLITEGKILGVLRIDSYKENTFELSNLRLLSIVANIASTTIKNAMLYRQTEDLAIKDGLTGLYVKTYFNEELAKQFSVAKAGGVTLSVLLLDMDNFKSFNDQYGHTAGDIVLKRYADILEKNVSKKCIVSRYGGEEFAILVPDYDEQVVLELAEKLREKIASQIILIRQEKLRGTVSIGVCMYSDKIKSTDEFVDRADKALYEAKRQGRNRVIKSEL